MLASITHPALAAASVTALPFRDGVFDVVLAAQVLDLVPDRRTAIGELRRVLAPGGACVAVTTGAQHLRSLRALVERAARMPGWRMHPPTGSAFILENAAAQLAADFPDVTGIRNPATAVVITDASIAADYVTSLATTRPRSPGPGTTSLMTSASRSRPSSTPRGHSARLAIWPPSSAGDTARPANPSAVAD